MSAISFKRWQNLKHTTLWMICCIVTSVPVLAGVCFIKFFSLSFRSCKIYFILYWFYWWQFVLFPKLYKTKLSIEFISYEIIIAVMLFWYMSVLFCFIGSIASFSNNPNVITNPNYDGPPMHASRTNVVPDDMRGHLVWWFRIPVLCDSESDYNAARIT